MQLLGIFFLFMWKGSIEEIKWWGVYTRWKMDAQMTGSSGGKSLLLGEENVYQGIINLVLLSLLD